MHPKYNTSVLDYVKEQPSYQRFLQPKIFKGLLMVTVLAHLFLRFQHASESMMAYLRTKTIYLQSLYPRGQVNLAKLAGETLQLDRVIILWKHPRASQSTKMGSCSL